MGPQLCVLQSADCVMPRRDEERRWRKVAEEEGSQRCPMELLFMSRFMLNEGFPFFLWNQTGAFSCELGQTSLTSSSISQIVPEIFQHVALFPIFFSLPTPLRSLLRSLSGGFGLEKELNFCWAHDKEATGFSFVLLPVFLHIHLVVWIPNDGSRRAPPWTTINWESSRWAGPPCYASLGAPAGCTGCPGSAVRLDSAFLAGFPGPLKPAEHTGPPGLVETSFVFFLCYFLLFNFLLLRFSFGSYACLSSILISLLYYNTSNIKKKNTACLKHSGPRLGKEC